MKDIKCTYRGSSYDRFVVELEPADLERTDDVLLKDIDPHNYFGGDVRRFQYANDQRHMAEIAIYRD